MKIKIYFIAFLKSLTWEKLAFIPTFIIGIVIIKILEFIDSEYTLFWILILYIILCVVEYLLNKKSKKS